jgi:steroid 5-alpha reductase family enzyme
MDMLLLVGLAVGLSLAMTAAWTVQRWTGRSGWIDTIWSFAVGIGGMTGALLADGDFGRRMAVFLVIAAWSLRLGSHIGARTRSHDEDPRYAKLAEEWGDRAALRLFLFLQIQALAAFILVVAVYLAATNNAPFPGPLDFAGLGIAAIALYGETISDRQLAQFRKTPEAKTEVCETGLWRYSRHPNYFFEWLFCGFDRE